MDRPKVLKYFGIGFCDDSEWRMDEVVVVKRVRSELHCKNLCLKEDKCKFMSYSKSSYYSYVFCNRYYNNTCKLSSTSAYKAVKDYRTYKKTGLSL